MPDVKLTITLPSEKAGEYLDAFMRSFGVMDVDEHLAERNDAIDQINEEQDAGLKHMTRKALVNERVLQFIRERVKRGEELLAKDAAAAGIKAPGDIT